MVHCFNSILITVGIAGNSMILPTDCLQRIQFFYRGSQVILISLGCSKEKRVCKKSTISHPNIEYRFRGKLFVHNFNAQGIIHYWETMGQTELLVKLQFDMEQFSDVMYPCYHIARRKMAISAHNGFGVVSYRCTSKPFFDALSR